MIADPELTYAELGSRLRALGWEWRREAKALPTLSGEPEHVVWAHADPEARLVYTFNPVVMLRVLAFSGPGAEAHRARTASFLPYLTVDAIADLIRADEVEPCLLGMFAARELGLALLLPLILARTDDADELIAQVASEVGRELPAVAAERVREVAERMLAGSTDPAALFSLLGDAALRRQVLRHAAATLTGDETLALRFLLQVGLADRDWEMRLSAMLLCGRLRMLSAREAIGGLALPEDDRYGHTPSDLERFRLLRRCVLAQLSGEHEPGEALARHAWRCITDGEDGTYDALFLLVHALTAPLKLEPAEPALPAHVRATESGFALARSGLPVVRVAPVPCWLGDPEASSEVASPLRRVVPRAGFFMLARPLSRALVRWVRAGGGGPVGAARSGDGDDCPATLDDARAIVRALAAIEGASIELPGADQWELAARGPDGRRYPWGNGREPNPRRRMSPWGLAGMTGGLLEWARVAGDGAVGCGGATLLCSERHVVQPSELLLIRPITC